jgi:hypothetical protein
MLAPDILISLQSGDSRFGFDMQSLLFWIFQVPVHFRIVAGCIGAPDNRRQVVECRVLDVVDAQDGVERAAFALMREFHGIDIVRNPTRPLGDGENLFLRDIDEFCIGIDKAPDQPGTSNAINLRMFSRNPLALTRPDVYDAWTIPVRSSLQCRLPGSQLRPPSSAMQRRRLG